MEGLFIGLGSDHVELPLVIVWGIQIPVVFGYDLIFFVGAFHNDRGPVESPIPSCVLRAVAA